MDDDKIICPCFDLTVKDIKNAVAGGAGSAEEVMDVTEAGSACGVCVDEVKELVEGLLNK